MRFDTRTKEEKDAASCSMRREKENCRRWISSDT